MFQKQDYYVVGGTRESKVKALTFQLGDDGRGGCGRDKPVESQNGENNGVEFHSITPRVNILSIEGDTGKIPG